MGGEVHCKAEGMCEIPEAADFNASGMKVSGKFMIMR